MRADAFEQDGVLTLVLHELKDDTQIVARATRSRTGELALQFVRLELGMKRVLSQTAQAPAGVPVQVADVSGQTGGTNE